MAVSAPTTQGRPAWLAQCATCVRLLADLDQAGADSPADALAQWEAARIHLIEQHPERVTAYDPECPNCLEWQATADDPDPDATMRAILARESLLHRAGHVIA